MSWDNVGDSLEFDQQSFFDDQVSKEFADNHTAVPYDQPPLLLDCVSNRPQGQCERVLVYGLREAMAKLVVNGIEDTDYTLCKIPVNQFALIRVHP